LDPTKFAHETLYLLHLVFGIITARWGRALRIIIFRKISLVSAQLVKKISSASFLSCDMFNEKVFLKLLNPKEQ
jgi:hypothetical protein